MALSETVLQTQPGKAIWTIMALCLNAARLPFWMLYFIPRSLRQSQEYSWRQAVRVRVLRAFIWHIAQVRMRYPLNLKPGKEKDQWVVMSPASKQYYVGPCTKDPEIQPEVTGGTWYPAVPAPSEIGKITRVLLHFHGGAYAIGNGRIEDAGFLAKTMLDHTELSHVFCPQYRLAPNPGGRFPAQLQDAVTSYAYLVVQMGIPPEKIVFSGDSAGGNLAISLVRYVTELGQTTGLPLPYAALLWSPWVQPKLTYKNPHSMQTNYNVGKDYLNGYFGTWGSEGLAPAQHTGLTLDDPYISFFRQAFKTEIPIYVSAGENEVLFGEDRRFSEEMKQIPGNRVAFEPEEHCVHDVLLVGKIVGFEQEAAKAATKASGWLKTCRD